VTCKHKNHARHAHVVVHPTLLVSESAGAAETTGEGRAVLKVS
jgi:hypothetical protein